MATSNLYEQIKHRIVDIRPMNGEEEAKLGWDFRLVHNDADAAVVIVLDNGVRLVASSDEEGNRPGALFALIGDETYMLIVQ